MQFFPQTPLALMIALCVIAASLAVADAPTSSLVCTFSGGVSLKGKYFFAKLREHTESRFLFAIPSAWKTQFGLDGPGVSTTYTNLDGPWQGNITAMLDGRMLRLLEKTRTDNAFYVHVWLGVIEADGAFQALYLFAGHQSLPKVYPASTLRWGSCRFTS
jgi:hypothetical protein